MNNSSSSPKCDKPEVRPVIDHLPPWKVILHNDDFNKAEFVVNKVQEITKLKEEIAEKRVIEANEKGSALLLTTHLERAELLVQMFKSFHITVTMEEA